MTTYTQVLKRLRAYSQEGKTVEEIAERMGVPRLCVYRHLKRLVDDGEALVVGLYVVAGKRGPRPRLYAAVK